MFLIFLCLKLGGEGEKVQQPWFWSAPQTSYLETEPNLMKFF